MNRRSTALFSALEACLVVGIGIGIPLSLLTVMWAVQYQFQVDWVIFWRAAVSIWALGHGVDITFTLDPVVAEALGAPSTVMPFTVTLALLGFAALTLLAGWQMGRRTLDEPHRILGGLVAVAGILLLSALAGFSASHPAALHAESQTAVFPTLAFTVGFGLASLTSHGRWRDRWDSAIDRLPALPVSITGAALLAGAGAVVSVVAVAAIATAAALIIGFAQVIALYESLQAEILGGLALTTVQLALIPTAVLWAASWFIGPGFALGTGSVISPLGTIVGPLPAVPLLGALPMNVDGPGFTVILVPVLAAFVAGIAVRPRLVGALHPDSPMLRWAFVTAGATALVAGTLAALLAVLSAGSAGPGRLSDVGPDPVAMGVWMLVETFIGASLGLLAGGVSLPWARLSSVARRRTP
jgi:hypothetical protein